MRARRSAGFHESRGLFQLMSNRSARAVQGRLPHSFDQWRHAGLILTTIQFEISPRHVQRGNAPPRSQAHEISGCGLGAGRFESKGLDERSKLLGRDTLCQKMKIGVARDSDCGNNVKFAVRLRLPASTRFAFAFVNGIAEIMPSGICQRRKRFHQRTQRNGLIGILPVACEDSAGPRIQQKIRCFTSCVVTLENFDSRLRE